MVDVYDSSDSFWLPVEILDVTTDFVDRGPLCTYRVIPPEEMWFRQEQCSSRPSVDPFTLRMSTTEFVNQLYHPAKFCEANLAL